MLVIQANESFLAMDGSRIKHEKLAEHQQRQMAKLLNRTQKVIDQCQTTNGEMKQKQWSLNVEFVRLGNWRTNVEEEMVLNMV